MNKAKNGQALLIVVLLLATVLTVVMTVVFTTRTESKVTKLQQESDRSLAAAEAGIEAAISHGGTGKLSFGTDLGLSNLQGIDPESTVDVTVPNEDFASPIIRKDDQYTLYLSPYNSNGAFGPSLFRSGDTLTYYYGSDDALQASQCDNLALEFTYVFGDAPYIIQREAVGRMLSGGEQGMSLEPNPIQIPPKTGPTFYCSYTGTVIVDSSTKIVFVRVLANSGSGNPTGTRIGITNDKLPAQGKYFTSQARTTSGVVKKVRLFQSYPQLPAGLFIPSFPF